MLDLDPLVLLDVILQTLDGVCLPNAVLHFPLLLVVVDKHIDRLDRHSKYCLYYINRPRELGYIRITLTTTSISMTRHKKNNRPKNQPKSSQPSYEPSGPAE